MSIELLLTVLGYTVAVFGLGYTMGKDSNKQK